MTFQIKVIKDDHGCFRAWSEDIPGASSTSFVEQEAIDKVQKIIESYVASFNAVMSVEVRQDLVRT